MKKYLILGLTSTLSALIAIWIYRMVEQPQKIVVSKPVPAFTTTPYSSDPLVKAPTTSYPSAAPTDFVRAASVVTPAVVNIKSIQNSGTFNILRGNSVGASSGSGVIVSPDGYIVTNNHVVAESDEIQVTLSDKREFQAQLIGSDPSTDLALIKIDAYEIPHLSFGNSDSLQIGEWVLAVGNPFNLASTVTAGIVSAKGRSIDILEGQDRIESFIQTDAAVNPGNSGGALVNTNGELIGINTAIITRSGRYEGYSFAVPANLARKVIKDLRDYGEVQRGLIGVFIDEVDDELARRLDLENVEGVYITRVTAGGGADDAGLEKGDVIISIAGVRTRTLPQMQEQVGRYRPGDAVDVIYVRDGEEYTAQVVLKNKSNSTTIVSKREKDYLQDLGFELRNLSREEMRKLGGQSGVKVLSVFMGSRIDRTNMEPNFIITKVNNEAVEDVEQLIGLLQDSKGKIMMEGVYEDYEDTYYYAFSLDEE